MIHLEDLLAEKRGEPGGLQIDAVRHGVALFGQWVRSLAAVKSLEDGTVDAIGQMSGEDMYSKIMQESGLEGSFGNWDQIGEHAKLLARKRRILELRLSQARLIKDSENRLIWY
jgi:hypothetical protein